ncbi:alanine racemase [Pelotomaculum propionicicum]|uniref:Alanine racemase n=1 Tax=Pelotomaculum propionicicum TaxID=258475 RepID=A0A4Y7RPC6_9FIRM|nr:alanine racemase [Pelotomaculum propionicicum]TEB10522.1 Alanine racemase 1 [Pelotomaculum propionicicum]
MSVFPVWAEIDLAAVSHNVHEIRRKAAPPAKVMAVVKANAYGHGAVEVSRTALASGADWLGVARTAEGTELREAGIEAPVLILGYITPEQSVEVVRNRLSQAVYTREMALSLAGAAAAEGVKAKIHFKVDTGMGRIGWAVGPGAVKEILELARNPHLEVEGIFTHFAASDAADKRYTLEQYARFMEIITELRRNGLEIPLRHAANSAAIMEMPETHLDLVRAGIIVYGLYPSDEVDHSLLELRPAISLKAKVAHVKSVPAGFKVSYGCTFTTKKPTVIATLPLGYADGYSRLLSSRGEALLNGLRAPVVGRVCMDQVMVDVGHIPGVKVGDEAVLIGHQGDEEVSADEVAAKIGTINYEVVCMISYRVPRLYK